MIVLCSCGSFPLTAQTPIRLASTPIRVRAGRSIPPAGFMDDLRGRLANRVPLTTNGHKAYLEAVEGAFSGDVDCAEVVKLCGEKPKAM